MVDTKALQKVKELEAEIHRLKNQEVAQMKKENQKLQSNIDIIF